VTIRNYSLRKVMLLGEMDHLKHKLTVRILLAELSGKERAKAYALD
jgi:hypothetical protein